MKAQRFNPVASAAISLSEQGEYVKYEDYAALAAKLSVINDLTEVARQANKLAQEEVEKLVQERDRLLASFDAEKQEPVGITDRSEIECLKRGEMANVMPPDYKGVDAGDEVYVYTVPPAPVVPDEWTIADAVKFCRESGRQDAGAAMDAWNACRAAMLQAGNSPVIPDGWKMVPIDAT